MKNFTVVAVVPTFNRRKLFEAAVQSVLNQTFKPTSFIILNNASTDETKAYLDDLQKTRSDSLRPELIIIHSPENTGASGGMHFLFKKALEKKPDWIWVMDDDGCAAPTALEELLKAKEAEDKETYILQSLILDGEGQWPASNRPALFNPENFEFIGLPETAARSATPLQVNTGPYCGLLIRPEAFRDFGFPKLEFYLWYDDVEFILRVSQQKKVYLVPRAHIQHFAQALVPHVKKWPFSGELPLIPYELLWRYYYLNRNWLWMAKQWLSPPRYAVFWLKHCIRNFATPLLLGQDHLFRRWVLAGRAGFDALFNRLGKRVFPPS